MQSAFGANFRTSRISPDDKNCINSYTPVIVEYYFQECLLLHTPLVFCRYRNHSTIVTLKYLPNIVTLLWYVCFTDLMLSSTAKYCVSLIIPDQDCNAYWTSTNIHDFFSTREFFCEKIVLRQSSRLNLIQSFKNMEGVNYPGLFLEMTSMELQKL